MAIEKEPSSYEKTVLSELQGAWQVLRNEVPHLYSTELSLIERFYIRLH
jgi:hypothetical protein